MGANFSAEVTGLGAGLLDAHWLPGRLSLLHSGLSAQAFAHEIKFFAELRLVVPLVEMSWWIIHRLESFAVIGGSRLLVDRFTIDLALAVAEYLDILVVRRVLAHRSLPRLHKEAVGLRVTRNALLL